MEAVRASTAWANLPLAPSQSAAGVYPDASVVGLCVPKDVACAVGLSVFTALTVASSAAASPLFSGHYVADTKRLCFSVASGIWSCSGMASQPSRGAEAESHTCICVQVVQYNTSNLPTHPFVPAFGQPRCLSPRTSVNPLPQILAVSLSCCTSCGLPAAWSSCQPSWSMLPPHPSRSAATTSS